MKKLRRIEGVPTHVFEYKSRYPISELGGPFRLGIWEWYEKALLCVTIVVIAWIGIRFYRYLHDDLYYKVEFGSIVLSSILAAAGLFMTPLSVGGALDTGILLLGMLIITIPIFLFIAAMSDISTRRIRIASNVGYFLAFASIGFFISHLQLEVIFLSTQHNLMLIYIYTVFILAVLSFVDWAEWEEPSYLTLVCVAVAFLIGFILGERGEWNLFNTYINEGPEEVKLGRIIDSMKISRV